MLRTRLLALTAGAVLASMCGSAWAINGNIYTTSCACQTTSDFSAAAVQASNEQGWGGTYLLVSSSVARTALMRVQGQHRVDKFGNDYWVALSATPMDDSGNSLAGSPEGTLQAIYGSFDQVTFGTSRNAPIRSDLSPNSAMVNFVTATDAIVSQFLNKDPNYYAALRGSHLGDILTLDFKDFTAEFQLVAIDATTGFQTWKWNGKAWDVWGNRVDHNGHIVRNTNTGGAGGGSAQVTGFGNGSNWSFGVGALGSCTSVTTITVNGEQTDYVFVHPC